MDKNTDNQVLFGKKTINIIQNSWRSGTTFWLMVAKTNLGAIIHATGLTTAAVLAMMSTPTTICAFFVICGGCWGPSCTLKHALIIKSTKPLTKVAKLADNFHTDLGPPESSVKYGFVIKSDPVDSQGCRVIGHVLKTNLSHVFGVLSGVWQYLNHIRQSGTYCYSTWRCPTFHRLVPVLELWKGMPELPLVPDLQEVVPKPHRSAYSRIQFPTFHWLAPVFKLHNMQKCVWLYIQYA